VVSADTPLGKTASRMQVSYQLAPLPLADIKFPNQVVSVRDLNAKQALRAALQMRVASRRSKEPEQAYREVVDIVGGRLAYLNRVARHTDMLGHARHLLEVEKAWLLSQIGLIPDHDDDVMDEVGGISCKIQHVLNHP
jgi:hypothetical protein